MKRLGVTLIFFCLLLAAVPDASAGNIFLYGSGSLYQTNDSIAPGWIGTVSGGYAFNPFLAVGLSSGYGNYYIEDADGDPLRVDFIPSSAFITGSLPLPVITPYVRSGPTWTWSRVAKRDWVNYFGLNAEAGLNIRIGIFGITPHVGYTFYDLGDLSRGALTYGLNFGFSVGKKF